VRTKNTDKWQGAFPEFNLILISSEVQFRFFTVIFKCLHFDGFGDCYPSSCHDHALPFDDKTLTYLLMCYLLDQPRSSVSSFEVFPSYSTEKCAMFTSYILRLTPFDADSVVTSI
jgi:hypothetical protein